MRKTYPQADDRGRRGRHRAALRVLGAWVFFACVAPLTAGAQMAPNTIILDGSTGISGSPTITTVPNGAGGVDTTYTIGEENGSRSGGDGSAIFFGFSRFDLLENDTAVFDPDAVLQTDLILGRINSGSSSSIAGTLRSTAEGARVVLLNSAGVTISGSARLDLSGSLTVGAADELHFESGETLDLSISDRIQISSSAPSAFGFFGAPGIIDVTVGSLALPSTPPGSASPNSLALIGNEVRVRGDSSSRELRANGGRIELAAVPNNTVVPYEIEAIDPLTFEDPETALIQIGDDIDDVEISAGSIFFGDEAPGRVVIRGGRVVIEDARLSSDNSSGENAANDSGIDIRAHDLIMEDAIIRSNVFGAGEGAPIRIAAERISLDGNSEILAQATGFGTGDGGAIEIGGLEEGELAERLRVLGASQIQSLALSEGDSGSISIRAADVEVQDPVSGIVSRAEGLGVSAGAGGDIEIAADRVLLREGGRIRATTIGDGNAGSVLIEAAESVRVEGVGRILLGGDPEPTLIRTGIASTTGVDSTSGSGAQGGFGNAGAVRIETPQLEVINGGQITSSSLGPNTTGSAGSVLLTGMDRLLVEGGDEGDSVIAVANRFGEGGELRIESDQVDLLNGGRLRTTTTGSEAGGELIVDARTLRIFGRDPVDGDRSGLFAVSTVDSTAEGGRIEIRNANRVLLSEGAEISATAVGTGDAGRIDLNDVRQLEIDSGARIRTDSRASLGGNIALDVRDAVVLQNGAEITTSVASGAGEGGNIDLQTRVLALERSQISADAVLGNGGNITVRALLVAQSGPSPGNPNQASEIRASSVFATDGVIEFATPDADLVASLAPLAEDRLLALPLRATPCAMPNARSERSRLVVGGGAGLPPGPQGWLPSWAGSELSPPVTLGEPCIAPTGEDEAARQGD